MKKNSIRKEKARRLNVRAYTLVEVASQTTVGRWVGTNVNQGSR